MKDKIGEIIITITPTDEGGAKSKMNMKIKSSNLTLTEMVGHLESAKFGLLRKIEEDSGKIETKMGGK